MRLADKEGRRLLKISENFKNLNKSTNQLTRQNLPPGDQTQSKFASVLDTFGKAGQSKASPEVKNLAPLTLQDYRDQAIRVRQKNFSVKAPTDKPARPTKDDLEAPEQIRKAIDDSARKFKLPVQLVTAIIKVESNFNPRAVSSEGARGLMQLMPTTAERLGVRNSFDITQNINGGCKYLKGLLERFDGNLELAVAAYNAGPGAVAKYGKVPPYRQTQDYVKKVLAYC